jgi:hypothetical protein
MIGLAAGTRIWIVAGVTDMRRGFVGLSGMVQTALQENPFSGQVYIFRGTLGSRVDCISMDLTIIAPTKKGSPGWPARLTTRGGGSKAFCSLSGWPSLRR